MIFITNCPFTVMLSAFERCHPQINVQVTYSDTLFMDTGAIMVMQKGDNGVVIYLDTETPVIRVQHTLAMALADLSAESRVPDTTTEEYQLVQEQFLELLFDEYENVSIPAHDMH